MMKSFETLDELFEYAQHVELEDLPASLRADGYDLNDLCTESRERYKPYTLCDYFGSLWLFAGDEYDHKAFESRLEKMGVRIRDDEGNPVDDWTYAEGVC